jgi:hypothetical protein
LGGQSIVVDVRIPAGITHVKCTSDMVQSP